MAYDGLQEPKDDARGLSEPGQRRREPGGHECRERTPLVQARVAYRLERDRAEDEERVEGLPLARVPPVVPCVLCAEHADAGDDPRKGHEEAAAAPTPEIERDPARKRRGSEGVDRDEEEGVDRPEDVFVLSAEPLHDDVPCMRQGPVDLVNVAVGAIAVSKRPRDVLEDSLVSAERRKRLGAERERGRHAREESREEHG
jgi:hypothetical protein